MPETMSENIGYHFVGDTLRDGRPVPADGVWLVHNGPLEMCRSGLHLSLTPFEALKYAPGSIICRVRYGGEILADIDKLVCRRRMIEARFDATDLLRSFVRTEALAVIHPWDAPNVISGYLTTGDESLRDAAWAVARAAARDSGWDDAWAGSAQRFDALVYAVFDKLEVHHV